MIQIGDYIIYPAGLAVLIAIPIILIIFISVIIKINKNKKANNLFSISKWQRTEIPFIIDDAIKSGLYTEEECAVLEKIEKVVSKQRTWSTDVLNNIADNAQMLIFDVLYNEMKLSYLEDNDLDRAILLINAIDRSNGLFKIEGNKWYWMDLDLTSYSEPGTNPESCVVKGLWLWIIHYMIDEQYPENEDYIDSSNLDIDDYVKQIPKPRAIKAANEIQSDTGLNCISNESADIIIKYFFWYIDKSESNREYECISELTKYYIRAIACAMDKNDYVQVIKSLR